MGGWRVVLVCLDFKVYVFTDFSSIQKRLCPFTVTRTGDLYPVTYMQEHWSSREIPKRNKITRWNKVARYTVYIDEGPFILSPEILPKIVIVSWSWYQHPPTGEAPVEPNPPTALQNSPKSPELNLPWLRWVSLHDKHLWNTVWYIKQLCQQPLSQSKTSHTS